MSAPSTPAQIRRTLQAVATRTAIVEAAHRLMLERGYVATSIGAIAAEAGVAVQTIYNSVGSKADLLSAVLELAGAGPESPALVPDLLRRRVAAAVSAPEIIRVLADWFALMHARTSSVFRVIGQAAAVDPDVAKLELRRAAGRLHNYGEAASALRARRGLRAGLSDHEAAAAIWAIGHPQVYQSFVNDLGWSAEAYREWLGKTLKATLS
ncbi:TetR/AcrR family transcriptional regulator [Cryobacterium tagatosivorans]|uniref:TetR/AcrR family transcriptional regulator n=1 Tax=Cryobacterium tagatosivorans TaxID=1259199 RepID=A0A4R8UCL7_9MICO|nr:TetR/AcrR family transcriptional regulator [Cryobacterium tagatosivorans]TFB49546.1 TetR/AcrR family transcriptional regulator [Cryobacterium tagatosivorans]